MKFFTFLILISLLAGNKTFAQQSPDWTRPIDAFPDSTPVLPVRTLLNGNNELFVLCTYYKYVSPGVVENKVYLRKYDPTGNFVWGVVFDNNGNGQPRGFDMALDNAGNCFVAGGLMATANSEPMLLKVSGAGNVQWMRDSTTAFQSGNFDQVIFKNNLVYLKSFSGVAVFDQNGNELWSNTQMSQRIAVDDLGQLIVSGYGPNNETIFRYDVSGNMNFSDSSIYAKRLACDVTNSFYLLEDYGNFGYALVKYNSAGTELWNYTDFPVAPPFGDIGLEVLVDYDTNVIVIGLSDTIYKFTPSGTVLWKKPMYGLDTYLIAATITFSNMIAVAGTVYGPNGNDMMVNYFNLNGNLSWSGLYSANTGQQEFTVDMAIDNSGIYVIEDNQQHTVLARFDSPFAGQIDYGLVCVDSVWYDPLNPLFVHVSIFNGNAAHMNYPSVQIVNPNGDTIGNPSNFVNYFAHLGNGYQTYTDTITEAGITDFHTCTFLIHEGFGSTTAVITWCNTTGLTEPVSGSFDVYPNPVSNILNVGLTGLKRDRNTIVRIFSSQGSLLLEKISGMDESAQIDVSTMAEGIYFVQIECEGKSDYTRFCKF